MTPDHPDDLDPRPPTRPRGHTLQDRLRRSAEQRVQHQVRAHGDEGGDELAALLDLLNNGPSVPPRTPPAAEVPSPPAPAAPPAPPAIVVPPAAAPPIPSPTVVVPPPVPSPVVPPPPPTPVPEVVAPPATDAGTFMRETFTRETFVPGPRPEVPFVEAPVQPETWDVAARTTPGAPWEVPVRAVPVHEVPAPEAPAAPWDVPSHEVPVARAVPAAVPLPPAPPAPPGPPGPPDGFDHGDVDPDADDLDTDAEPGTDVELAPARTPAVVPDRPATLRTRRRMKRDIRQAKRETRMAKRRYRILPRTVIGITAMLLAMAIAAGASGAVLYAYYDWRLTQNEDRVGDLAEGLETRLSDANVAVENATNEAVTDVREEGEALRALINDQNRIVELQPRISASVWYVSTLDDSGRASVGSAFVVAGDADGSLLLTSYTSVSAATVDPAPEITLRKGDETMVATLYAWDPARDLALLTVTRPDMEPLVWANEEQRAAAAGKRGFVVSGLGGSDATFSPGQVLDLTATGIMHNVAISEQFQGGPLLDEAGNVLGVASMEYNPLNFESTGAVSFGVPVGLACEQVLTCNGDASGAG